MKILTVEDNEINAKLMDYILNDLTFDFTNTIATSAKEALNFTSQDRFNLILMDINLGSGQMDGSEVMSILKDKDDYQEVPMYAITCYTLDKDRIRFLEAGFDRYFTKPINHSELLRAISEDQVRQLGS
ncbi:response regulator [Ekhidna sp.]